MDTTKSRRRLKQPEKHSKGGINVPQAMKQDKPEQEIRKALPDTTSIAAQAYRCVDSETNMSNIVKGYDRPRKKRGRERQREAR